MLTLLIVIYAIASLFLVIFVLLQAGKGAGMGLFGGGGSNTTFGAQGGDILTRITTVLGVIFFGIALIIAFIYSRDTTLPDDWADELDGTPRAERIIAPGEADAAAEEEDDADVDADGDEEMPGILGDIE